eukprot:1132484-Lingulodinium_polyedra.AAC.1
MPATPGEIVLPARGTVAQARGPGGSRRRGGGRGGASPAPSQSGHREARSGSCGAYTADGPPGAPGVRPPRPSIDPSRRG